MVRLHSQKYVRLPCFFWAYALDADCCAVINILLLALLGFVLANAKRERRILRARACLYGGYELGELNYVLCNDCLFTYNAFELIRDGYPTLIITTM